MIKVFVLYNTLIYIKIYQKNTQYPLYKLYLIPIILTKLK